MEQPAAHNNHSDGSLVLQVEDDPVSLSVDAANKQFIPDEPMMIRKPGRLSFLLQKAAAETIGTFFVVLVGGIVCVGGVGARGDMMGHATAAISGGLVVIIMIFSTAQISGAHLNPAVTLGFSIAGLFPWTQVLPYIFSQITGSLLASITLQVLVRETKLLYSVINEPLHHDSASLVMECAATFLLMVVNMKVARNLGQIGELGGIFMIGMTVALLGFLAGLLGGNLSMNPARSIGPALLMMRFKSLHIFVVGPIMGAMFSGLIYGMIVPSCLTKSLVTNKKYSSQLFTFSCER